MSSETWFRGAIANPEWEKGVVGLTSSVFSLLPELPAGMHYELETVDGVGPEDQPPASRVVVRVDLSLIDQDDE